jgi:hypothetical protein
MLGRGIDVALAGCGLANLRRRQLTTSSAAETSERTEEEIADQEDDNTAKAETTGDQWQQTAEPTSAESTASKAEPTSAGIVRKVCALGFVAETHAALLVPLP